MSFSDFLKGSSIIAAMPTILYMGMYRRKNRLNLPSNVGNFASIPYESIVVGILLSYGVSTMILKRLDDKNGNKKRNALLVGSTLGLLLSIIGRYGFDLPVKHFGMMNNGFNVHIIAPVLYAIIFLLYISPLIHF